MCRRGVGEGGDIWVTRRRGASYKLNLCNYGSNYAGIRAITCAPTVPDTLVPSLRLLPSLLMNDSVGLRLVETCRSDRLNRDTAFSFYGVGFDRRPMDSWFHFGNRITVNGYNLSLRHVIIVIRLRVDSYCLSSSRIPNVFFAYFCTIIIKFRNSYRFTFILRIQKIFSPEDLYIFSKSRNLIKTEFSLCEES